MDRSKGSKRKKQQAKSCKELGDPDEEDQRKRTSLVLQDQVCFKSILKKEKNRLWTQKTIQNQEEPKFNRAAQRFNTVKSARFHDTDLEQVHEYNPSIIVASKEKEIKCAPCCGIF